MTAADDPRRYDAGAAAAGKTEGMARAARGAGEDHLDAALVAIRYVAATREEFTTDATNFVLEQFMGVTMPNNGNGWGPAMQRAARLKLCRKANKPPVNSVDPRCHGRPKTVWASRIHGRPVPPPGPWGSAPPAATAAAPLQPALFGGGE